MNRRAGTAYVMCFTAACAVHALTGFTTDGTQPMGNAVQTPTGDNRSGRATSAQLDAWIRDALKVMKQEGIPGSYGGILRNTLRESGGDPTVCNTWDINAKNGTPSCGLLQCVTMETEILTRRGWLSYDQVHVGDETIGYNPATGKSEWTIITDVVRHENAPVWRIGNGSWYADVTPNHRWWSDTATYVRDGVAVCPECGWVPRGDKAPERGVQVHRNKKRGVQQQRRKVAYRGEFVRTEDLNSQHRIRLAAPSNTSGTIQLTEEEVRTLAWIQGDGHFYPTVNGYGARIWQSKPEMLSKLRELLGENSLSESVRQRQDHHLPSHCFGLSSSYVTDLLDRSRLFDDGPEVFVLRLSSELRSAWLDSMIDAEGHRQAPKRSDWSEYVCIAQVDGPLQEAIKIAVYLEGYRPTPTHTNAEKLGHKPSKLIGMAGPHVAPGMFHTPQVLPNQDVWCVKTGLETWTARQHGFVFLTGNTIRPTFDAHKLPQSAYDRAGVRADANNMTDPVANLVTACHYAWKRYGSIDKVNSAY